jgi:tetratricopeptide (TPR) repeat protein
MQKDISINGGHTDRTEENLARIESAIVPLEAADGTAARRRQNDIASARQMIAGMEREASADADYSGKLSAWSGRLAILEGRYSEAQRLYRQAIAVSPGNMPSIILGIRLEGDPSKRLEIIERELALAGQRAAGVGELNIERGRSLFELNRFSEAAGAFDTAFSSGLNAVYIESYGTNRNRAWELRNTSGIGAGTLDMLGRGSISWNDCISIAKNETQLLRFVTGGRNLSDAELFNRLIERGFLPSIQDITVNDWPKTRPAADDVVTRAGAAWFIWHLYAEARADRGLLTRYSARYATGANPRSPITDVPPLSPFFDSILGCVETELMSLPDGRNFRPAQSMRGAELLAILRRIDG